jgi:hypothetical protein
VASASAGGDSTRAGTAICEPKRVLIEAPCSACASECQRFELPRRFELPITPYVSQVERTRNGRAAVLGEWASAICFNTVFFMVVSA